MLKTRIIFFWCRITNLKGHRKKYFDETDTKVKKASGGIQLFFNFKHFPSVIVSEALVLLSCSLRDKVTQLMGQLGCDGSRFTS